MESHPFIDLRQVRAVSLTFDDGCSCMTQLLPSPWILAQYIPGPFVTLAQPDRSSKIFIYPGESAATSPTERIAADRTASDQE